MLISLWQTTGPSLPKFPCHRVNDQWPYLRKKRRSWPKPADGSHGLTTTHAYSHECWDLQGEQKRVGRLLFFLMSYPNGSTGRLNNVRVRRNFSVYPRWRNNFHHKQH